MEFGIGNLEFEWRIWNCNSELELEFWIIIGIGIGIWNLELEFCIGILYWNLELEFEIGIWYLNFVETAYGVWNVDCAVFKAFAFSTKSESDYYFSEP